jgi:hypothetical protein
VNLGEHGRQFAAFLTYAALDPGEGYTSADFQAAIGVLPHEGLQEAARALSQALESAGEQREDYWKNRVQLFWQQVWPKSRDLASNSIAESLALLCIAAGGEFPSAVAAVVDWLRPVEHPHNVVHQLHASGLCARFPEAALRLLDAILTDQPWAPGELVQCLEAIDKRWRVREKTIGTSGWPNTRDGTATNVAALKPRADDWLGGSLNSLSRQTCRRAALI